jgi:hypothetical protein
VIEPGDLAGALPKLNVVALGELFSLFHGLSIIGAFEFHGIEKMPV